MPSTAVFYELLRSGWRRFTKSSLPLLVIGGIIDLRSLPSSAVGQSMLASPISIYTPRVPHC